MPRIKDQALCIRLLDWSETSQVVELLTEQHGKVRGLAKGSKRASPGAVARYCGGIELLTGGQIVGIIKKDPATLANITEWDLQRPFPHLRRDLAAQRLGFLAADLCHWMLEDLDPHPRAFAELGALLDSLAEPSHGQRALLRFQWRLLEECGYRPELDRDVASGGAMEKRGSYTFDPIAGGLREAAPQQAPAQRTDAGPWRVRADTVDLLRSLAAGDALADDQGDDPTVRRANRLLCVYARAILDRELPTMGVVLDDR